MKKVNSIFYFILISLFIGLSSCKKTEGTKFSSIAELKSLYGPKKQVFKFQASAGGTITTAKGWKFTFEPDKFYTEFPFQWYSGEVSVEIIEMKSKSEILFSNATTVALNGIPLTTGGMFNIRLKTSTGAKLKYSDFIEAFIPDPNPDPNMKGYFANPIFEDSDSIAWINSDSAVIVNVQVSGPTPGLNINFNPNYQWINCDHPFTNDYCQLNIELNEDINYWETGNAFIFIKSVNSAINVYPYQSFINYYFMPSNYDAFFIAYKLKDNQLHCATKKFNINSTTTYSLNFEPATIEQLLEWAAEL